MTDVDLLIFGSSCFLFGVSLFCANLLVLQDTYGIHRPLALFCGVQALLQGLCIPLIVGGPDLSAAAGAVIEVIAMPLSLTLAPLFWLYVRRLTAEDGDGPIRWKALHLAPIALGVGFVLLLQVNHREMTAAAASGPRQLGAFWYALMAVELIYFLQIAVYMMLSSLRIATYRARLKDLFASTEDRELRWIVWIVILTGLYLVVDLTTVTADLMEVKILPLSADLLAWLELGLPIVVIWIIAVWGTRQKPGLYRPEERAPQLPDPEGTGAKYERSALTPVQARRIAGKITAVMEADQLYRDPNLSLWGLANRIGVTSNHISQTLNETLGESFFDHVNKWRVKDAIEQLTKTDQSILTIAYDVGFNSRSPFYKAFKRETGMTPTELRARLQAEAALPGRGAVLPDVRTAAASEGEGHAEDRQGLHPHHRGLPA
jgi:AraC-like DNA-binding protein